MFVFLIRSFFFQRILAPPGGRSNNIFGEALPNDMHEPVVKNSSSSKPVELTAQQQASANKKHNQNTSMMFGDSDNANNNNGQHGGQKQVYDAVSVKNKQRSTYNPITGQSHEEENQQREQIKQQHIHSQQRHF